MALDFGDSMNGMIAVSIDAGNGISFRDFSFNYTSRRQSSEIVVIGEEVIIERGTHEELLAKNGEYATLYKSQFRD